MPSESERLKTRALSNEFGSNISFTSTNLQGGNDVSVSVSDGISIDACNYTAGDTTDSPIGTTTSAGTYTVDSWVTPWVDSGAYTYKPTGTMTIIHKGVKEDMVEKRSLFRVYVVDPRKTGKVLSVSEPIIADSDNQAMLKAGVATVAVQAGLELEQVDVFVEEIGTFIRPRKETQRVKITKDEEE